MNSCDFIKECTYINETIKYEKSYSEVMKSNFCTYYFKNCAIWRIANKTGLESIPKNLLPFQHRIVERAL